MSYIPGRLDFSNLNDVLLRRKELDNGACLDIELIMPLKEAKRFFQDIKTSEELNNSHPIRRYGFFVIGDPLIEGVDIDCPLEKKEDDVDNSTEVRLSIGFACSHDAARFYNDPRFLADLKKYYTINYLVLGGFYRDLDDVEKLTITKQKIKPSGTHLT